MNPATLNTIAAPPPRDLFEVVGLKKEFDGGRVQALRGVNLRVFQGEFLAITTPSGCGKTALLQMLGALDRPTAGTLLYRAVLAPKKKPPGTSDL
jgi:ABC-type lipoprotein export system ATPase subunit